VKTCALLLLGMLIASTAGCSPPEAAATPTHEPVPPTPTPAPPAPTPAYTVATSAEQVLGLWRLPSAYVRFDADGRQLYALELDDLESSPNVISTYRFQGDRMIIQEVSASGVPPCGGEIGTYQVRILPNGDLNVIVFSDACEVRARENQGEYMPVK
jgi:hypothetical protein